MTTCIEKEMLQKCGELGQVDCKDAPFLLFFSQMLKII